MAGQPASDSDVERSQETRQGASPHMHACVLAAAQIRAA